MTVGDNEREAYIASVGGLGMESFVFLWLSMAISQGLKIIADIATLASRNCSPGAKRVVTALTPKKVRARGCVLVPKGAEIADRVRGVWVWAWRT